ncbi:hypothetical protein E3V08_01325 [Candidatus Atribacteria bacterium MT.SAG.1]|nr:hypothetical protein E3V08_01325 [Candidatus Atribacteria bacterium MT.SAG.1]
MSYCILYHSFNPEKADLKWREFDSSIKSALENSERIKELRKKEYDFDEYNLDDEEIYNPKLKNQVEKKRAEITKSRNEVEQKLRTFEDKNPASGANILYNIDEQKPIEADGIIPCMIDLDLRFGGKAAYYSSAMDPISQAKLTLGILFPELDLDEGEEFTKEQWIAIFKNLGSFNERFEIHKKEIFENEYLDESSEEELASCKSDLIDYLSKIRPVIKEITGGAQLFVGMDSTPDDKLLADRAKKHIEQFKNHPLLKIPLQNYEAQKG